MKHWLLAKIAATAIVLAILVTAVGILATWADAASPANAVKTDSKALSRYVPDQMDVAVLVDSVQAKAERVSGKKLSSAERLKLYRAYRTKYAKDLLVGTVVSSEDSGDSVTLSFKPENPAVKAKLLWVTLSKSLNVPSESEVSDFSKVILHVKWDADAFDKKTYGFSVVHAALK